MKLILLLLLLAGSGAMGQTIRSDAAIIRDVKYLDSVKMAGNYVDSSDFYTCRMKCGPEDSVLYYSDKRHYFTIKAFDLYNLLIADSTRARIKAISDTGEKPRCQCDPPVHTIHASINWNDTLHFAIPVPPGTVGWQKDCDTCSVRYFGFYDRYHISDYPGRWSLN
jgi:hypothetical protein